MTLVSSATNDDDDDGNNEFQSIPKKSFAKNKKRFYIGNLPTGAGGTDETVQNALRTAVAERTGLTEDSIQVQNVEENEDNINELCSDGGDVAVARTTTTMMITVTGIGLDQALQRLRGLQVQGNRVQVRRERRRSGRSHVLLTNTTKPTTATTVVPGKPLLTGGGWSKPQKKKEIITSSLTSSTTVVVPVVTCCAPLPVDHYLVDNKALCVTSRVSDQDLNSGGSVDSNNNKSILASMAVAEVEEAAGGVPAFEEEDDNNEESTLDFYTFCQKNQLSTLLDEYGTHDPEWTKVQPTESTDAINATPTFDRTLLVCAPEAAVVVEEEEEETVVADETECRLERQGKAPIHVEFVSFGYRHGVPAEIRCHSTGNSHRQPLPAFDCRCLTPVPHYLAWMSGLSGAVKNAMLRQQQTNTNANNHHHHDRRRKADTDENKTNRTERVAATDAAAAAAAVPMHVRDFAKTVVAVPVADAVRAAVEEGGYGYAAPLRMTIHLGSEQGRHRSVVTAELAATALRRLLRQNAGHRFPCSVSVGCRHRDIDQQQPQQNRPKQQEKNNNNSSCRHVKSFRKQKDLEDD